MRNFCVKLRPREAHHDNELGCFVEADYTLEADVTLSPDPGKAEADEEYVRAMFKKDKPLWDVVSITDNTRVQ